VQPPPPTRRDEVVDVLHGVEVPDPYRWLEDGDRPDVVVWAEQQNERTREALDARPDRARWHERLVALLGAPVVTSPRVAGTRLFTLERTGGAPQHVLVMRSSVDRDEPPRTLLDPAALADDGTAAIDWFHPSHDGRLVAYGCSQGGDERSILRVLDVETGEHLADEIPDTRAASVGWWPDGSGFLYTRYPAGDEYHRTVHRHRLGDDWSADPVLFDDLPTPESWPDVTVSHDGAWVIVHVLVGWDRVDVHLMETATGQWSTVVHGEQAMSAFHVHQGRLIGTTTLGALRGRVVTAPFDDPAAWTTIVEEGDGVIDGVTCTREALLVASSRSAVARLDHHLLDGALVGPVELPELGSFAGISCSPDDVYAVCSLESFTRPASLLRWTPESGLVEWGSASAALPFDPSAFRVTHETYRSADGTPIGLFVVQRADLAPDAATPCILTGYGGFAIAETPVYSALVAAWCEMGGVFAVAGLRGGYEEGEAWHHAGRREHKQNVFDDFHAAAEHLVATGRTSPDRLALRGGSNGGLLVGAALTQRPELARAVHCAVPLLDMVRYPQFLIARLWTDEYGDPDVADEFAWLWAYSPYHRVQPGTCYPAVLFTCAESDSRVDPLHARKMAAALQQATGCQDDRPILLRQESRAGHGVGKPLGKQADEAADVLAFLAWQLDGPSPP
jgi:prolyl oligopeptidase